MKLIKSKHNWLLIAAAVIAVAVLSFVTLMGLDISSKPKIGFIMTGETTDSGWNGSHYQGIAAACDTLGASLIIEENIEEGTGQCAEAVHRLAKKGVKMIVLSSYAYPAEVKDIIDEYSDIAFYGISASYTAENMTSYFGRIYQARYLAGIIAGMQTESNNLGYVAAMANSEVNRGINAFTLGARSVNPDVQVNVIFTDSWEDEERETAAAQRLIDELGADVLTYHQNKHYVAETADKAGVYSIGYNEAAYGLSDKYLTAAVWDWESLYYRIIREYMQGNTNAVKRHWFGLETGAVRLTELSPLVSEEAVAAVENAKNTITMGVNVFSGTIYDNNGVLRSEEDEMLSDELLFEKMDWFVDGVVIYE